MKYSYEKIIESLHRYKNNNERRNDTYKKKKKQKLKLNGTMGVQESV